MERSVRIACILPRTFPLSAVSVLSVFAAPTTTTTALPSTHRPGHHRLDRLYCALASVRASILRQSPRRRRNSSLRAREPSAPFLNLAPNVHPDRPETPTTLLSSTHFTTPRPRRPHSVIARLRLHDCCTSDESPFLAHPHQRRAHCTAATSTARNTHTKHPTPTSNWAGSNRCSAISFSQRPRSLSEQI